MSNPLTRFFKTLLGIKNKLKEPTKPRSVYGPDLIQLQRMQNWEDETVERDARREAQDMLHQYMIKPHGILIPTPRRIIITVYTTPKYDSDGYNKLRQDYFTQLKTDYDNRNHHQRPQAPAGTIRHR